MPAFLANIGKSGDVAERSPAVISANLKEDILLQKKLVVLNRSERSVVHQVKVDQKVMYRRFQAKLTCSKLAHARLMGQRQLQRQLRAKNIGKLNTDIVGNTDEDFAFLDKLEQRPCTADSYTPCLPEVKSKKKSERRTSHQAKELGKSAGDSLPEVNTGRSSSAKARYVQDNDVNATSDKDSINSNRENVRQIARPATTLGTRVDEEYLRHELSKAKREKETGAKNSTEKRVEFKPLSDHSSEHATDEGHGSVTDENQDSDSTVENTEKPTVAFLEDLDIENARPNTVPNLPCSESPVPLSPTSPKQLSRRASKASDFFHAEVKIDPISLRLKEAKAVDFTDDVSKFCTELEQMKGKRKGPIVDYYASRLEASLKQINMPLCEVPGTPDDENLRCVGNLFVRSLTVPELDWDFTGKQ